jgi:hypothetical protein
MDGADGFVPVSVLTPVCRGSAFMHASGSEIAVRLSVGAEEMQIVTRLVFEVLCGQSRWSAGLLRGSGRGVEGSRWWFFLLVRILG